MILKKMMILTKIYLFCRVYSSSPVGRWGPVGRQSHSRAQSVFLHNPGDEDGETTMHNTKHMCPTIISTEGYLSEQIKKPTRWLYDVFMQEAKVNGPSKVWNSDHTIEVTQAICECMKKGRKYGK